MHLPGSAALGLWKTRAAGDNHHGLGHDVATLMRFLCIKKGRSPSPTAGLTLATRNIILNIMKTSRKAGASDTISTHQMRFEFERVLRAVKAGRSLTLTYRSKPLARIVPLKEEQALQEDDPIFRLGELAEPIGPLTNAEIDTLVYDQ